MELSLPEEAKKMDESKEEKPQPYISKVGFVTVPVLRGFTEIAFLFSIAHTESSFICGGYARYCASPNKKPTLASDVDIYCKDKETFERLKGGPFKELSIRHENDVSLTYNQPKVGPHSYHPPIQLIKPIREGKIVASGEMKEILENFDFTVIRCGFTSSQEILVDADFLHDEERKILRLKNIHCPISSTLRCMKYAAKGYWLKPFETLKLFLDWDSRSDEYRNKLVDFLEKSKGGEGLSKEDITELEALMRID